MSNLNIYDTILLVSLLNKDKSMTIKEESALRLLKIILVVAALLIFSTIISLTLGIVDAEALRTTKEEMREFSFGKMLRLAVLEAPLHEEIRYRGPAFLLTIFLVWVSWAWKKATQRTCPLEYKIGGRLPIMDLGIWSMVLVPNYFWAIDHALPLQIFALGVIFGWIIVHTKSIFSIGYCIALHAAINLLVTIAAKTGLSVTYAN